MLTENNVLRRVHFSPYRGDEMPRFTLTTWDTGRTHGSGKYLIGYRLTMRTKTPRTRVVLFEGEDFGCSPMHAIDSDATIAGIMGFLTLRPGETDREYFDSYSPEQLDYCAAHAEALASEVMHRFPE